MQVWCEPVCDRYTGSYTFLIPSPTVNRLPAISSDNKSHTGKGTLIFPEIFDLPSKEQDAVKLHLWKSWEDKISTAVFYERGINAFGPGPIYPTYKDEIKISKKETKISNLNSESIISEEDIERYQTSKEPDSPFPQSIDKNGIGFYLKKRDGYYTSPNFLDITIGPAEIIKKMKSNN